MVFPTSGGFDTLLLAQGLGRTTAGSRPMRFPRLTGGTLACQMIHRDILSDWWFIMTGGIIHDSGNHHVNSLQNIHISIDINSR